MNVGQIFETHLGWAARGLGKQIQEMLEDIHERGKEIAGKDVKAMRAKLKDIYGDHYHKDIDARDDDGGDGAGVATWSAAFRWAPRCSTARAKPTSRRCWRRPGSTSRAR